MSSLMPPDAEVLRDFPQVEVSSGWRFHRKHFAPVYFFRGPSRFCPSDIDGVGAVYLSTSAEGAVLETFGQNRVVSEGSVLERSISEISLRRLRLADGRDPHAAALGFGPEAQYSPDYSVSQAWATQLLMAGFDGLVYSGRFGSDVIAVFGTSNALDSLGVIASREVTSGELEVAHVKLAPIRSVTDSSTHRMGFPVVFVSYSWEDKDHQDWVRDTLVNGLRSRQVDARMDQHSLSFGDQVDSFMETAIPAADHLLVVCTPQYYLRAAQDKGGVGYEKHLIRAFIEKHGSNRRVIPVLRKGEPSTAIPPFLGSRMFVDLRGSADPIELLDELAAVLCGTVVHRAPPVG